MSAKVPSPLKTVLTQAEFGVLTMVAKDNALTPEGALKAILEEYVDLRANHTHLYVLFAVCRQRFLK